MDDDRRGAREHGHAGATIARRFGTVATFYKYAVIDGVIPSNPADAVTRPNVAWEGQKRTVLHPLEFAALLSAARTSDPNDRALVCLLGMLGLRVSEACAADIGHQISPHGLRRTFCTTGLVAGIALRDMQYAMRHADSRTTLRYDLATANLDRHAAHAVAAYLARMSTG